MKLLRVSNNGVNVLLLPRGSSAFLISTNLQIQKLLPPQYEYSPVNRRIRLLCKRHCLSGAWKFPVPHSVEQDSSCPRVLLLTAAKPSRAYSLCKRQISFLSLWFWFIIYCISPFLWKLKKDLPSSTDLNVLQKKERSQKSRKIGKVRGRAERKRKVERKCGGKKKGWGFQCQWIESSEAWGLSSELRPQGG